MSQLYVSNVPESATIQSMREVFAPFGKVARVDLREKRGFGFVVFDSPDGVTAALQSRDSIVLDGVKLSVELRRGRRTFADRQSRGSGGNGSSGKFRGNGSRRNQRKNASGGDGFNNDKNDKRAQQ